jgi:hypothetical protein
MRAFATLEAGRLVLADPATWRLMLAEAKPGRYVVTVEPERHVRSTQANRYWWGVVVDCFRGIWSKGRTALDLPPYTKEEAHSVLVQVILGSEPGPLPGSVLAVPTRNTNSKVFAALVDKGRELAYQEYRVHIPPPGEGNIEWL